MLVTRWALCLDSGDPAAPTGAESAPTRAQTLTVHPPRALQILPPHPGFFIAVFVAWLPRRNVEFCCLL